MCEIRKRSATLAMIDTQLERHTSRKRHKETVGYTKIDTHKERERDTI